MLKASADMTQRAIDGDFIYFVTFNVHNRRWFFVDLERTENLGQAMQTCCQMKHFHLLAYCILPNHVHLLVKKGGAIKPDRTLERVRSASVNLDLLETGLSNQAKNFLFAHRRLSSRRSFQAVDNFTLSDLMKSIKGTFSRTLPKGKFWHRRSFVRIVDNQEYFNNLINYIQYNYRKMNLDEEYGQPPFLYINWPVIYNTLKD